MSSLPTLTVQGVLSTGLLGVLVSWVVNWVKPWIEQVLPPSDPRHNSLFQVLPFVINVGVLLGVAAISGELTSQSWQGIVLTGLMAGSASVSAFHIGSSIAQRLSVSRLKAARSAPPATAPLVLSPSSPTSVTAPDMNATQPLAGS